MILTQKQRDGLWGEDKPYSQVQMITEARILGDKVSRMFVLVEVSINPFTINLLRKYSLVFADDPEIRSFLDHAEFRGQHDGYVSCAYSAEIKDAAVTRAAKRRLVECELMVIRMHKFVLSTLES